MQGHREKERGWAAIVAKMGEAARRYDYLPIAADTGMSWAASTHTLFLQLTEAAWRRARDAGERYTRGTHRRYWRAQLQRALAAAIGAQIRERALAERLLSAPYAADVLEAAGAPV